MFLRLNKNRFQLELGLHAFVHWNKLVDVDLSNNQLQGDINHVAGILAANCSETLETMLLQVCVCVWLCLAVFVCVYVQGRM